MKLHDAIIKVLINQPNEVATIDAIANEININKFYVRKDEQPLPAYQVKMRAKLSKGKYHHLFEWVEPNLVKLKKS